MGKDRKTAPAELQAFLAKHPDTQMLELLQPDIAKLCPSLRELDRLETGMTQGLPDGTRLNLIKVDS